jgi:FkbM family methyltransferase
MMDSTFVSYAQHGEDVVIWRALGHVTDGFYVDVGAADPVVDSVTHALYAAGWSGIDIDALAQHVATLRAARRRDIVVEAAVGAESGTVTFYATPGTGLSSTIEAEAESTRAHGFRVEPVTVAQRTLDEILEEHVPPGRALHVLKIDVEGGEAAVLAALDLTRWRPWVVVVEATRPLSAERTDGPWRHLITDAGYSLTMFDGLNIWFLSDEHPELAERLSYPACPIDRYVRHVPADDGQPVPASGLASQAYHLAQAEIALASARKAKADAEKRAADVAKKLASSQNNLKAMRRSPWWRVTRPGRSLVHRLKRLRSRRSPAATLVTGPLVSTTQPPPQPAADVVLDRLMTLLAADGIAPSTRDVASARAVLAERLTGDERARWVWASYIVWTGSYPDDLTVDNLIGRLDLEGVEGLFAVLDAENAKVPDRAWTRSASLEVCKDIAIDATHTATHDLHTGIQRVVRETVSRWAQTHVVRNIVLDPQVRSYRWPTTLEDDRVLSWPPDTAGIRSTPRYTIVMPWRTRVLVPEVPAFILRADLLRGLAVHSGSPVGFIGYDLIPVTRGEATQDLLPSGFSRYLSALKYADRVSAISETVASEFVAFSDMLVGQGIEPPSVRAQLLPAAGDLLAPDRLAEFADSILGVARLPLVVCVASIEPRKNHMRMIEAAERLWQEGVEFQLLFVAGSSWKNTAVDESVERLQRRGRPLRVLTRVDDETLWACYQLARCSVFVSLVEGYGLPAAESLALGTPVVLTGYGSMAEIAKDGGALLVDPRDVDDIAAGIRTVVVDDSEHARLVEEARRRPQTTWDAYAADTWSWLVDGVEPGSA